MQQQEENKRCEEPNRQELIFFQSCLLSWHLIKQDVYVPDKTVIYKSTIIEPKNGLGQKIIQFQPPCHWQGEFPLDQGILEVLPGTWQITGEGSSQGEIKFLSPGLDIEFQDVCSLMHKSKSITASKESCE